jgi:hypothetical protein
MIWLERIEFYCEIENSAKAFWKDRYQATAIEADNQLAL